MIFRTVKSKINVFCITARPVVLTNAKFFPHWVISRPRSTRARPAPVRVSQPVPFPEQLPLFARWEEGAVGETGACWLTFYTPALQANTFIWNESILFSLDSLLSKLKCCLQTKSTNLSFSGRKENVLLGVLQQATCPVPVVVVIATKCVFFRSACFCISNYKFRSGAKESILVNNKN